MSKSIVVAILLLGIGVGLSTCLFGCGADVPTAQNTQSSGGDNSSAWLFLLMVVVAVVGYLLYIFERQKVGDSLSKMQKELKEFSAQLERQHKRIQQQENLMTSLRISVTRLSSPAEHEGSPESWDAVTKGMTQEAVNRILGAPMAIYPTPDGEMFHYGKADMEGQIFFVDEKVAFYSRPGIDKKLTDLEVFRHLYQESFSAKDQNDSSEMHEETTEQEREQWNRIEKGMTEEEVIGLVGKPHQIQTLSDEDELWMFGPPYSNRQIKFSCGKVVGFERRCNA
jgi:outer membrane protein assembly factor BamE (lipoprotein component of BamABCDE complex)